MPYKKNTSKMSEPKHMKSASYGMPKIPSEDHKTSGESGVPKGVHNNSLGKASSHGSGLSRTNKGRHSTSLGKNQTC